jgi:Bax protein
MINFENKKKKFKTYLNFTLLSAYTHKMKNSGFLYGVISVIVLIVVYFAVVKLKSITEPKYVEIDNLADIIALDDNFVPLVIYNSVPNLDTLNVAERKAAFINILLPSILLVKDQILSDRAIINSFIEKGDISKSDSTFLNLQLKTYKVKSIEYLPERMIMPPVSIVLAQAALESGWGTSRFIKEGNNIFGMWSYSESHNRMAAAEKRGGVRQIYVRTFPDIYSSILNFCQTLGRVRAYKEFRKAMETEDDPYVLVDHLIRYSERGTSYIETVKLVMRRNDFTKYDDYKLLSNWALAEEDETELMQLFE